MICLQRIFTIATHQKFTPSQSMGFAKLSVSVCQQLGIRGRAFTNDVEALFIAEGQGDVVKQYYDAVIQDHHTDFAFILSDMRLEAGEFDNYSVWLTSYDPSAFDYGPCVHLLTPETLDTAIPATLSSKLKIKIDCLMPDIS